MKVLATHLTFIRTPSMYVHALLSMTYTHRLKESSKESAVCRRVFLAYKERRTQLHSNHFS